MRERCMYSHKNNPKRIVIIIKKNNNLRESNALHVNIIKKKTRDAEIYSGPES